MLIKNVYTGDLLHALDEANKIFDNNLLMASEFKGHTRQGMSKYRVNLRVRESHGKGARLSYYKTSKGNRKHLINACWHAVGVFMQNLPEIAEIHARNRVIKPNDL
jgi:hypothetical protein